MKNYKTIWKSLHNNVNATDVINYCIIKAMAAKTENKLELIKIFLSKAFTPIRNPVRLANGATPYQVIAINLYSLKRSITWQYGAKHNIFGVNVQEFFDTMDELEMYKELVLALSTLDLSKLDRHYCYIFVDNETVTPEQAMVQAAHATMVVGKELKAHHNPYEIFFQIVQRPNNVTAHELGLKHSKFDFHHFVEPDLGNKIIGSATTPIPWYKREELKQYPLLSFK
jgi:hypothetical protein